MMLPGSVIDPRYLQISCLSFLLGAGVFLFAFDLSWMQICLTMLSVFFAQWACSRVIGLPFIDYKSAAISGLSLCLLLRSNSMVWVLIIAFLSIGIKFVLRLNRKHVFNPTNFGLAVGTLCGAPVWISPGQWGNAAVFAGFVACLGMIVVNRSLRSDVTAAFLVTYSGLLLWRASFLGDPWTIPLHQIGNGGVIIFSFFMISDPKTTPDTRIMRVLFGAAVAYTAYKIRFTYYTPNALIWALFFLSPVVPLMDKIFKAARFEWPAARVRAAVVEGA